MDERKARRLQNFFALSWLLGIQEDDFKRPPFPGEILEEVAGSDRQLVVGLDLKKACCLGSLYNCVLKETAFLTALSLNT